MAILFKTRRKRGGLDWRELILLIGATIKAQLLLTTSNYCSWRARSGTNYYFSWGAEEKNTRPFRASLSPFLIIFYHIFGEAVKSNLLGVSKNFLKCYKNNKFVTFVGRASRGRRLLSAIIGDDRCSRAML